MNVVVIYESLTGNTRRAGELIAAALAQAGVGASVCPATRVDYQALSAADVVVVGTWTDGIFVVGQRPGRANRLRSLPVIDRKRCVVYCTYAINPGKTLAKLTRIMEERGAQVLGGMAIRRNNLEGGAREFVERLLVAVAV
jgi:Flavodoxin domain